MTFFRWCLRFFDGNIFCYFLLWGHFWRSGCLLRLRLSLLMFNHGLLKCNLISVGMCSSASSRCLGCTRIDLVSFSFVIYHNLMLQHLCFICFHLLWLVFAFMRCFHLVRLCMCSNFFLNLLRVLVLGGHVHLRSEIKIYCLCSFLLIWFVIDNKSSNSLRFQHIQAIHWILRPLLQPFW